MRRCHSHRNTNGKTAWILLIAIVLVVAVSLYAWKNRQPLTSAPAEPAVVSEPDKAAETSEAQQFAMPQKDEKPEAEQPVTDETKAKMEVIKAKQAEAAKAAIVAQPIEGNVSDRPDFVSEIEWDVLKGAVAQNEDVDKALSHFVNKLLFFKKREAWMNDSTALETRQKLARELLAMIPQQLSERAIDQTFADKLSNELNTFLSTQHQ